MNTDIQGDKPPAEQIAQKRRSLFPWINGAIVVVLLGLIAYAWLHKPTAPGGHKYFGTYVSKDAPDFALTDQDGKPFQFSSLRGKVVLMTFGFTHCPNICPTTLGNMSAIYRNLSPDEQKRVQIVFISVDPERDTPAVLKEYVPYFQAGFLGLTGTPDQLKAVTKDYGAFYEKQYQASDHAADYYTVNHSAYIYLINPAGKFDLLYDNEKFADSKSVLQDIRHELDSAGSK